MKEHKGLGLAANQVGINKRFFAIDMSYFDVVKPAMVIVNPVLSEFSDNIVSGEEGCLSFPGLWEDINRPESVLVKGLDVDGNEISIEATGLMARVIQHETDHLNGKLFIDHLSRIRRGLIKGKLKKIKAGETV